jgi:D-3-phosphoglycerate dehydrogenase
MLPRVDYLTVHTPLTEETRHLVGHDEIERIRPGARLINCARGGIYDEAALAEGLRAGKLAGVALDVFAEEPCTSSPLFGMPGVVCTPHLGASTEEAQTQVATEAVGLLIDYLTTGAIRHAVNMVPVDRKTLDALRSFVDVARRLGLLLAGMQDAGAKACRVTYQGEIAHRETKLLTAAFAAGLLENALEESVNIVNAELLLRERGVELVEESRGDMGAFRSSITAEVVTDLTTNRATGTLFGETMPRLVALENYRLDAYLDGILMVFRHHDVPGIIGNVGTIFGQHQVNIAQMAVGREGSSPGGDAIGVMNLDAEPPAEALEAVRSDPAISSVRIIRLPPAGQLPAWLQA